MIEQLLGLYRLKDEQRAGWLLRGVDRPESVSDHSWGTALLCLLRGPEAGVDVARAVSMALVHDLPEALTGDRPSGGADGPDAAKRAREEDALARLFPGASRASGAVHDLWREYEERATREARFVRDMNLIDMCLQALIYEADERYASGAGAEGGPRFRRLEEFFRTTEVRLLTAEGRSLFRDLADRYRRLGGDA